MLNAPHRERIARELRRPVEPAVLAAAEAVRKRHGGSIDAILYYGSCLRDGWRDERILDFYVLVDRYRDAYASRLAAMSNALLPPNVFYLETEFQDRTVRSKYAVMSLAAFERGTASAAFQPTFWGRFAQPCALAFTRDDAVTTRIEQAVANAATTMMDETRPLLPPQASSEALWTRAFAESYRSELRAERPQRGRDLYRADRERYDALTAALAASPARGSARRARWRWRGRRVGGKLLSVLRLLKAAFTFTDGLDYILWKIGRHSGATLRPTPWQRRHPILAAPVLAYRLYRRGGFR